MKRAIAGAVTVLAACGALDESAPPHPKPTKVCVALEERLAPLTELSEQGKLRHIARIVAEDLDDAGRRAVLKLAIDIGKRLPPGTLKKLPAIAASPDAAVAIPLIVAVLEPLPGDTLAKPPVPPKSKELAAFSAIASSCLQEPLFTWLGGLLREPELAPAVDVLLRGGTDTVRQLQKALTGNENSGRAGFAALFKNVATAIAQPDFDPRPLVQAIAALRDPNQPGAIDAIHTLARLALLDVDGRPAPHKVAAASQFMRCARRLDPDAALPGHWYDVLIATPLPQTATPTGPSVTGEVVQLAAYAVEALAELPAARDALAQALGLILRPDLAVVAIPELVGLLESDALRGMVLLLGDLVNQPCRDAIAP